MKEILLKYFEFDKNVGSKKIDVIIDGLPCPEFSLAGPRNFDEVKNKLYLVNIEAIRIYITPTFL